MSWSCLAWIRRRLGSRRSRSNSRLALLPEDILIDILSRLPPECVLQCRSVCKRWKLLTSTQYFARLNLSRRPATATPSIIVQFPTSEGKELFSIENPDGFWVEDPIPYKKKAAVQKNKRIKKISSECFKSIPPAESWQRGGPFLYLSSDGLLLFKIKHQSSIIFNPITLDKVILHTGRSFVCGIFFHPIANEYCVILAKPCDESACVKFNILVLGELRWIKLPAISYRPRQYASPAVLLKDALHWMVLSKYSHNASSTPTTEFPSCSESILVFDIRKQEFRARPHPGDRCPSPTRHYQMHLLEMDDHVSLFCLRCSSLRTEIDVWKLVDHPSWLWVKSNSIVLNSKILRRPPTWIGNVRLPRVDKLIVIPLGVHNGELILHSRGWGLFLYNLCSGTLRKFQVENVGSPLARACIHAHSLVLLNSLKPEFTVKP